MAGRLVKAGALPALLACADFWQPQVARAAAAALAALTEDAGAAVALMRATPADIEKSAGAPSMAAGGGGGLGALLTMVGSTDGATQLAALAAFGHVCAHPANTAALVRARALDRLFTFIGGSAAAELQTVALGGVAALCEHAAVSEGELSDERRLLPTLLSIARGSLTQRGSPPMRRDALRALGALCGQRPLQRALIEGEGLPPSLLQICAAAAHVAEQKAALLALLRLLRVPHARARSSLLTSPSHARALRSRCESEDATVRCAAAVALAFLAADSESTLDAGQPPRDSWASLAEAEERGSPPPPPRAGRRGAGSRRLARRRRRRRRRRCGEGEWRRKAAAVGAGAFWSWWARRSR